MKRRLQALLSDGFWLYLFPASAALMPWPWYFAACKWMTRAQHPYRAAIEEELAYAQTLIPDLDANRFRHEQALVKFVDAADFYLTLTRTHRWFRRYVIVEGAWPEAGKSILLLGTHWGAAHWIWHDLKHHGISAWFLARQGTAADFGRGRLAQWYGHFRGWGLRRAGCAGVITTGGALAAIEKVLANGESVVVLNDVPGATPHRSLDVTILGKTARLPRPAIDKAIACEAMIVTYSMSFTEEGSRILRITKSTGSTSEEVISAYATNLEALLKRSPGLWQIWSLAPELFQHD